MVATQKGRLEVVKLLLGVPGIEVNRANKDGETPLDIASEEGHAEVVKLLLGAPCIDVNPADKSGTTPFSWASRIGRLPTQRQRQRRTPGRAPQPPTVRTPPVRTTHPVRHRRRPRRRQHHGVVLRCTSHRCDAMRCHGRTLR